MSEPVEASRESEPKGSRRSRRSVEQPRTRRDVFALVGKLGGLVGLVASVAGLVFLFFPGLKPVHVDTGTASITDVRVLRPVTYRRYLEELELPRGTVSREQLRTRGILVSFHYQLDGFRGRKLPLRWELSNAATNALVDQDQAVTIVPLTNSEGRDWFVWVPQPGRRARYYITVTLYQPEQGLVPLKRFDTRSFTTAGGRP